MASTLVGPIRIPQINRNYYVGEPMQRNIQQAVTFAIADSNAGNVIVPQDYTGSDTVAAVTGGSPTVYIIDERHGQRQAYLWYDNAYIYEPTHASGGVLTPQLNNYAYVGFGTNPTIQGVIDNFAVLPTLTITIIIEPSYTGGEVISNLTNGDPGIVISDQRTAQWQNYNWNGIQFVPTDFEPLGQIIAGTITAADITADSIEAGAATFDTCIVDYSPVRTFANTADAPGGMLWPDIGIPVSLGDAWQSPSIDPTTIPRLNTPNIFTVGQTAQFLVANGDFTPNPIIAGGGVVIDYDATNNHARISSQNSSAPTVPGLQFLGSNAPTAIVYLECEPTGATFGPDTTNYSLTVNGNIGNNGDAFIAGNSHLANGHLLVGMRTSTILTGEPMIATDNTNLYFNSARGAYSYFNFDLGGLGVRFFDGLGGGNIVGSIDQSGNAHFNGNLTAGVKSFRIPYPHDDTKHLTHSCIEGPEIAVYYRGEAETHDGVTTITLPEYFEGLTLKENRSVQLTERYDDEDNPVFGNFLAAGRIRDGKFNVRSSTPAVKFYWEVMAVRADVDELEVVTLKETLNDD